MTTNDPTLFPLWLKPRSRATDPATSDQAEAEHKATGRMGKNLRVVCDAVGSSPGCTATELWRRFGVLGRHEWSRRLADAANAGLVQQGEQRRCRVKHSAMVTWWPVEAK